MNGPDHYREAERRLLMAWEDDSTPERSMQLVAEAQVHATLALAAATATQTSVSAFSADINSRDVDAWDDAIAPDSNAASAHDAADDEAGESR
ncbi:hypothetical protein RVR_8248 [Actinacidiphila reveromycinica]|uniref:Uncharacterized protein n=1 Tax=Actinacidiphila reveromycinica TaxID=659352 RepID=A0A7U3UYJ6_9ACTN|nr:hypothetical protein [Streptomyces sp. SN-593]BBB01017.1 hypothetical protein RVR_8248 [Streptomyces sp. SN-593]